MRYLHNVQTAIVSIFYTLESHYGTSFLKACEALQKPTTFVCQEACLTTPSPLPCDVTTIVLVKFAMQTLGNRLYLIHFHSDASAHRKGGLRQE